MSQKTSIHKNTANIVVNLFTAQNTAERSKPMPIKQENKKLYPHNWKQIRAGILHRSQNKCEFCGVSNYSWGYRDKEGEFHLSEGMQQEADALDGQKIIQIVLTIAHLDHNPQNNKPDNLRALCQRCHLRHDIEQHRESRRNNKKLPLFETILG